MYPNGTRGATPIQYTGAETNSITWQITNPSYYLKGDYFLNFSYHLDKNAGEQPRTIRMYAYYDDGTRVRMEYISPVKVGVYGTPLHFNLLVAGGEHPAYFRGETAVSTSTHSHIDNIVVSDFFGNVVRNIGKKSFNGYWFQYELGTLNAYPGGGSGIFSCKRLEFDWEHNPVATANHCIFAIDEVGNEWDDVQITYQTDYQTQDYFCWYGGLAKETAVVRRRNAIHVAVTRPGLQNWDASIIVKNRDATHRQ